MTNLSAIASALNSLAQGAVSCMNEHSELEHYLEDFFVSTDSLESDDDSGKTMNIQLNVIILLAITITMNHNKI